MDVPLTLSFSTCFVFAGTAAAVWFLILKHSKGDKESLLFAWFWFFASGVVGFMGLRTLLFGLGFIILDLTFALIDQIFLIGLLIVLGHYLFYKVSSKEKLSKQIAFFIIAPLSILSIVLMFYYIYQMSGPLSKLSIDSLRREIALNRVVSDWGSEFAPPKDSLLIIGFLGATYLILLLYDLAIRIIAWQRSKSLKQPYRFYATVSLIIFLVALFFDQRGINAGWKLLIFRTSALISALIAYLAYSSESFLERGQENKE